MSKVNRNFSKVNLIISIFLSISVFVGVYALRSSVLNNPQARNVPHLSKAIQLNANQDNPSYIEVANSADINAKKDFTIEAWIKPQVPEVGGHIFSKSSGSENGYILQVYSNLIEDDVYAVNFRFNVADANLAYRAMRSIFMQYEMSAEEIMDWHHVAGVIQPDGQMDIFVNGKRSTMNTNSINNIWQNTLPVTIGARVSSENSIDNYLEGIVDEVRISSKSRYPDNFIPSTSPFQVDEFTQLLYHFERNVFDSSGNAKNGYVYGGVDYVNSIRPNDFQKPKNSSTDN